MNWMGSDSKIF